MDKDAPESTMQLEEEVSRNSEQLEWGGGKAAGEELWLTEWVSSAPSPLRTLLRATVQSPTSHPTPVPGKSSAL